MDGSVIAVIPARGGSKGIPGKNLTAVGGRPLLVRTIDAARAAQTVDRVVVSTDDAEIARVATQAGAEVIERPAAIACDTASSESAVLHALDALLEQGGSDPDVVVMLQCTSPFTTADDIDGTICALHARAADAAFTAVRSHSFLWRQGANGVEAVNHDAATRPRRQDREPEFIETGAVYAMCTAGFRAAGHRFFGMTVLFETPPMHALEIDEPTDLVAAEAVAATLEAARMTRELPATIAGLALDFDGVLTDNRVMTLQDGTEAVLCDRGDGMGIEQLRAAGLALAVLSKEQNPVVSARCRKLSLECVQGTDDKAAAFTEWMARRALDPATVVFVGNDVNDLECLELAGCGVAVADSHPDVLAAADLVLSRAGGRGAVRELTDLILAQTGRV